MKPAHRSKRWAIGILTAAALLLIAKVIFIPPGPALVCHRALDGAFSEWMLETDTNAYPNIDGNCLKSFSVIAPYYGEVTNTLKDYAYVPGLRPGDPTDLVMIYVREKSHRAWHGDSATIFSSSKWITIAPGFDGNPGPRGELNDWIDTSEFKARLAKTIEFLKEHQRPFWQNVVQEQSKFLDSLKD